MYSSPDVDQYLEGLILAIDDEILPQLSTAKAQTTAVMMQAVLQQLRQTVPVFFWWTILVVSVVGLPVTTTVSPIVRAEMVKVWSPVTVGVAARE